MKVNVSFVLFGHVFDALNLDVSQMMFHNEYILVN